MFLKSFIILLFLFILLLLFFLLSKHKISSYEYYTPTSLVDGIYITNTINSNVICLETNDTMGINISMKNSSILKPTYYSVFKFISQNNIVDIQCANGNSWYYNESGTYGVENVCETSTKDNLGTGEFINLKSIDSSQIFQNALLFENGTMISFDLTGTHMIISTIPTNILQSVQCIFALGTYDIENLNGNTFTIINNTLNPPKNNFFYNPYCNLNLYGVGTTTGINFLETNAIYVPSNISQTIIAFSNGCFIDGSIKSYSPGEQTLRFVGSTGVVNFNFNNYTDIFQIWNFNLSNYFYYNNSNKIGVTNTVNSIYTNKKSFWDMYSLNLLPYTINIPFLGINFSYVDQILIYNPLSGNNLALLIQVETNPYLNKTNVPDGGNNFAITISSVIYKNQTMTNNSTSQGKFFFNLKNSSNSDIFDFVLGNNYFSIKKNNNQTNFVLNSNQKIFTNTSNVSTKAIRNNPPNLLVFENTINFSCGTQIGIDPNGNCIWKGSTAQMEFSFTSPRFCLFGINADGSMNYSNNNLFVHPGGIGYPIGKGELKSGTIHQITAPGNCGLNKLYGVQVIDSSTGNFIKGLDISSPTNSDWPCSNVTALNPQNNYLFFEFTNGYTDSSGNTVPKNYASVIEPNFVPSTLVSSIKTSNIINGKKNMGLLSTISFSNNIQFISENTSLVLQGNTSSYITNLNQSQGSMIQIKNVIDTVTSIPYNF